MATKKQDKDQDKLTRIAIVDANKCKPRKCKQECKKNCPVVRMGACVRFARDRLTGGVAQAKCA